MSRKGFDDETPLPPHGRPPMRPIGPQPRPCMVCHEETPYATLSSSGSRCMRCFREFCVEPLTMRGPAPIAISVPKDHPHAWAHRLRAKADAGQHLNHAQRGCLAEFERKHGGARHGHLDELIGRQASAAASASPVKPTRERLQKWAAEMGIDLSQEAL